MHTPNSLLEALSNETLFRIAGREGEARHQALLHRWYELRGMSQMAILLGVDRALKKVIDDHQAELTVELRAG